MTPELKADIESLLADHIAGFKIQARRVGTIAADGGVLSGWDIDRLREANDLADASMTIQSAMVETGDDIKRLIRKLQGHMSAALKEPGCSITRIRVFNEVLIALRLERDGN